MKRMNEKKGNTTSSYNRKKNDDTKVDLWRLLADFCTILDLRALSVQWKARLKNRFPKTSSNRATKWTLQRHFSMFQVFGGGEKKSAAAMSVLATEWRVTKSFRFVCVLLFATVHYELICISFGCQNWYGSWSFISKFSLVDSGYFWNLFHLRLRRLWPGHDVCATRKK